jgi:hypothetical protein
MRLCYVTSMNRIDIHRCLPAHDDDPLVRWRVDIEMLGFLFRRAAAKRCRGDLRLAICRRLCDEGHRGLVKGHVRSATMYKC